MEETLITVITPTTGKLSLDTLQNSLMSQVGAIKIEHILLWDDKREDNAYVCDANIHDAAWDKEADNDNPAYKSYSLVVKNKFVFGGASGSALRSIGLMAATGQYVAFADDDVWFEPSHLSLLLESIKTNNAKWAYCKRKIWHSNKLIGVDDFESVGDSPKRKVPYEMVDNNTMMFARMLGSSGACLYRETTDYNDDRLMYQFLKQHGAKPAVVEDATVNQICPDKLVDFFTNFCTKV